MCNIFCQEPSEVKRKSVKRTFKSEKEFLEFTLKYQQVVVERDSGFYECSVAQIAYFHFNLVILYFYPWNWHLYRFPLSLLKEIQVLWYGLQLHIRYFLPNEFKKLEQISVSNLHICLIEINSLYCFDIKGHPFYAPTFVFLSSSAVAVRDKLESLCRELQRQNKVLMVLTWLLQIFCSSLYFFLIIRHVSSVWLLSSNDSKAFYFLHVTGLWYWHINGCVSSIVFPYLPSSF